MFLKKVSNANFCSRSAPVSVKLAGRYVEHDIAFSLDVSDVVADL